MAPLQSPKLIARNVGAVRRFADPSSPIQTTAGNPVSTRLESGIGNCFPGLECDLRNLERRFFPFLEVDISDKMSVARVDTDGVAQARASGALSQADAATYSTLASRLTAGRSVLVSRLAGNFGVLGSLAFNLEIRDLGIAGDLAIPSAGPGRRPPDTWTAVRLLTEGTDVTLTFVNDRGARIATLTAKRARYLDDNGTLSAAFLPGELSQSLCSPWTHDFRDCGCYYWASNHPDIAQPALPTNTPVGQPWNAAVPWERGGDRTITSTPPIKASMELPDELAHYEINNRWQELHFVVGRREITAPFVQTPVVGVPFASRAELMENLTYAAGVELAVAQEYLAAAYSLKPDASLGAAGDLRDDVKATRAEIMRIAIGEMRHIRAVNDVIRGLSDPGTFEPALRVASQLPHQNPGPFRPVAPRAATRQVIADFIEIEAAQAPGGGVDSLYNNILATLEFPPADVASFVTDEWKQAIRSVIAEGEDHFETFLDIQEWLRNHAETEYLRSQAPPRPPAGNAQNAALQGAYASLLNNLFTGYKKGRFLGSIEINAARNAMVGAGGIVAKAEAVASQNFLVVFVTPADPRFAPIDPPGIPVA